MSIEKQLIRMSCVCIEYINHRVLISISNMLFNDAELQMISEIHVNIFFSSAAAFYVCRAPKYLNTENICASRCLTYYYKHLENRIVLQLHFEWVKFAFSTYNLSINSECLSTSTIMECLFYTIDNSPKYSSLKTT